MPSLFYNLILCLPAITTFLNCYISGHINFNTPGLRETGIYYREEYKFCDLYRK